MQSATEKPHKGVSRINTHIHSSVNVNIIIYFKIVFALCFSTPLLIVTLVIFFFLHVVLV